MRSFFKSILVSCITLALSALALQACTGETGTNPNDGCVVNTTQTCTCTGTDTGVQVCQPGGTFSPCNCNAGSSSSSSSSGMGGGGGSGGGGNCHDLPNTPPTCGNGTPEAGEECDDGNCVASDTCNNNCKLPYCGDGVVQPAQGEVCDGDEMCPSDCGVVIPDAGPDTGPCEGKLVYAGLAAAQNGAFSYNGQIGYDAATAACQALGGFDMCDYDQWKQLEGNPAMYAVDMAKLALSVPVGTSTTVWLHRTTTVGGNVPAPCGRCNDWNYPTSHIADGETLKLTNNAGVMMFEYTLDPDPICDFNNPGPHQNAGMDCNKVLAIPCCYEKCIP